MCLVVAGIYVYPESMLSPTLRKLRLLANIRCVTILSTTPISRCDCPTTGNIARYPEGGVFRHYRTSPSTSNKDMYNCLMRCAYKVCLPYGCALHDPYWNQTPNDIQCAPPYRGAAIHLSSGLEFTLRRSRQTIDHASSSLSRYYRMSPGLCNALEPLQG